jgi:hypothetical protein
MAPQPPIRIDDFTDEFPLDAILAERSSARLDAEWVAAGGVSLDMSPKGLDEAAEGGKALAGRGKKLTPPTESTSESARDRANAVAAEGPVRQGMDKVFRTLTGLGLDEVQKAVETGTLPEKVSLKLMDPAGQVSEELVRDTAIKSGMDEETASKIAVGTSVLLGAVFPGAKGKFKAGAQAVKGVNPMRLEGAADDVTAVIENIGKFNAQKMTQGVQTNAETISRAIEGYTLDQILKLTPEKYDLASVQAAVSGHLDTSVNYAKSVAMRIEAGDATAVEEYTGAMAVAIKLQEIDAKLGTQLGRGQQARQIALEDVRQIAEQLANAGGEAGMTIEAHAARFLALTQGQRKTFLQQLGAGLKQGQNMFMEAWVNALISGPQTHVANVLGTGAISLWAPVERGLTATADAILTGGGIWADRSVYFGETAQMYYGMLGGIKDGIRLVGKQLREESKALKGGAPKFVADPFGSGKMEKPDAITAEAVGLNPNNIWGGSVDFLGAFVRSFGRGLMTEDAFLKSVNYRGELRALAFRQAANEGLGGKEFWRRVRQIENDPEQYGPQAKVLAERRALTNTLNREFDELGLVGMAGQMASSATTRVPLLRLVAPFTRTPANSAQYGVERVPILAQLSTENWKAITGKDPAARAEALAKWMGGAGVSMAVVSYASQPINPESPTPYMSLITGEGPKDGRMRQYLHSLGWQPYSIWNPVSGKYVSYRRSDPLSTVLGIAANYKEIAGQLPQDAQVELATALTIATQKAMLSKTFLTGLSDLVDTLEGDPSSDARRFFDGLARSGVPAIARQWTRANEPLKKDIDSLFGHWRSGLPGYDAPAAHNVWGDEIMFEGGLGLDVLSPYYETTPKADPVTEWLVKNEVFISTDVKAVGSTPEGETPYIRAEGDKAVRLEAAERQRLRVLIGKGGQAPENGTDLGLLAGKPTLKERVADFIAGAGTDGPGGTKGDKIQSYVNGRRQQALKQLRREFPRVDLELTRRENEARRAAREGPAPQAAPQDPGGMLQGLLNSLGR